MSEDQIKVARQVIGNWIKEMRVAKGYSQSDLGDKIGIDQATVSKVEAGRWSITIDMLSRFCIALDAYLFLLPKESNDDLAQLMRNRWKRANDSN